MDTTPVRRLPLALGIAAVVLVLDQATKFWAERTLTGRDPIPVLGDFLQFRLLYNPGAAFSMGEGVDVDLRDRRGDRGGRAALVRGAAAAEGDG